jgi:hypothetical protein
MERIRRIREQIAPTQLSVVDRRLLRSDEESCRIWFLKNLYDRPFDECGLRLY